MSVEEDWHNPERRTMQRLSLHLLPDGSLNGMLLIVNGRETNKLVTLPEHEGVVSYDLVWDSSEAMPPSQVKTFGHGEELEVGPVSTVLLKVISR
jgi:glycogen operon protein